MNIAELINNLPAAEREQVFAMAQQYQEAVTREKCQQNFLSFVKEMWPGFIPGRHHAIVAKKFQEIAEGKLKRLIICMPPRHTKSEFGSYLFPAWFLGRYPDKKIIQTSNTAELAVGFGRKVRNLIDSDRYQSVFPDVSLRQDSKAAGRWATNHNGDYFAIGVGGTVTGKGADCAHFSDMIYTKRGIIPISDVCVGDMVKGYDHGKNKFVWTPVIAISTQRKPEVISVNGVLLTPEHRIYTQDGYKESAAASSVAVPYLPENVFAHKVGACKDDTQGSDQVLLFKRLFKSNQVPSDLRMWEQKSTPCDWMQRLLSKWEARKFDVRTMWRRFQETQKRVRKGHEETWSGASLLWQSLLSKGSGFSYVGATHPRIGGWGVPDLQEYVSKEAVKPKILRHGLLFKEGIQGYGVLWGMEFGQIGRQEKRSRDLRVLWPWKTKDGSPSYRPQRQQPHPRERDCSLRAVPQPLSSSSHGACARDFKDLLQGEGHWVVDIQTGTSNFLIAPPDAKDNFMSQCLLAHNCLIIDDPHSEQEAAIAATSPEVFDKVYEWYSSGPRQRLQPGGAIVVIMTRWSKRDLVGQVLKAEAQRGGEGWEVIEFPAILPSGNPLWPEFWPKEELEALKAELPNAKWQAQYQQNPTSDSAAIIKREWWRRWEQDGPPACDFILQAWDTAFESNKRADYSACTTWGVFEYPDNNGVYQSNLILLNAVKDRVEFPELKKLVLREYKEWDPDSLIIEKKASGAPLIYELRRMGISVQEYTPVRGAANSPNTKITRLNAVSDLFASGRVWAPNTQWADEVIDEVASFPNSEHDDLADTVSLAMMRFRKGGFIKSQMDEEDEPQELRRRFEGYY
jgi:predicted phage terminase large subunit-like protein